ncbi:LADA_0H03224g1_1 [Lachancea dasiensis]|uniref:LADA_0H03224g1_1 n=1 Tax=Lachancea dasiensis TaxID=1072105 RepID=A0A1G4K066_9SACH|nr:LADA_0H03224g1_1 [Lachancea dasiensis]
MLTVRQTLFSAARNQSNRKIRCHTYSTETKLNHKENESGTALASSRRITNNLINQQLSSHTQRNKRSIIHTDILDGGDAIFGMSNEKQKNVTKQYYKTSIKFRTWLRWKIARQNSTVENTLPILSLLGLHDSDVMIETQEDIVLQLIRNSLTFGDIANAVDLYIWYYKHIKKNCLDTNIPLQIIECVGSSNTSSDKLILSKILQLMEFLRHNKQSIKLKDHHILDLCTKIISNANKPSVRKSILNEISESTLLQTNSTRNAQILAFYSQIEQDCKKNNPAGVLQHWAAIKLTYTSLDKHDHKILYRIIKLFTNQKAYRHHCRVLISSLDPVFYVNNSLLLPSIINFSSKTNDFKMATKIMTDITKYANRETVATTLASRKMLSTLLRLHLTFRDANGVQKVLNLIEEKPDGMSAADYQAIILNMLKTNSNRELKKAILLTKTIPGTKALPSLATIITKASQRLSTTSLPGEKVNRIIIQNLLRVAHNLDPNHTNNIWDIVASLYVSSTTSYGKITKKNKNTDEYLLHKKNSADNAAFLKCLFLRSSQKPSALSTTDPFNQPNPSLTIIKLNKNNRLVILRTIAKEARFGKRVDILTWCVNEMAKNGMSLKEIELDWSIMEKHQVRRLSVNNRHTLTSNLKDHGVKSFKKVLSISSRY